MGKRTNVDASPCESPANRLSTRTSAAQAAFYLRLAEFKAATDPSVTFNDLVVAKKEQELQHKSKHLN